MQFELALLTMVTRQIVAHPLEDETAAARLKQIALMTVIVIERLHTIGWAITLAQLVDITGLTRNVAAQTVDHSSSAASSSRKWARTPRGAAWRGNSRSRLLCWRLSHR